ncbi:DsbA family oxidoreductase [Streptomyces olivochromogenes]|uniref:DSBA oxidoreductase n=1 Tax=Streptomyces olivochromogenes TaxID=1963 RepID=A0A286PGW9_STROL|nr:DsbA family oxidoreductase [Streptomyces olivochromogenes]KUN33392.1 disulfide bond formation protein DsbA [Streptomyces olivochromogenes]GAX58798.1 DSBA oxidoreductase [Streptomyces olivochromogenes]
MEPTATPTPTRLTVDVWADVLCPWCYLGEQRLSRAIDEFRHGEDVELRVHTFQLDPQAPATVMPTLTYLADKYGAAPAQARAMEQDMAHKAAAEGLRYEVDRPASNTFDMLRLVHLGGEHDVAFDYLRAMQAEVFSGNDDAFAPDTLVRLGEELGISADASREVLATNRYADAVRTDHDQAVRLGATGVPFTVLGERLGIPGAVSTAQYATALDQAWEQIHG